MADWRITGLTAIVAAVLALAVQPGAAQPLAARGPGEASKPCPGGDVLFQHLPTKLADIAGVVPLGNLNPKGHTIPTRHIYFYPQLTVPGDLSSAKIVPVFAPTRAEIVAVEFHPGEPDWSLHLKPCKDVSWYYFHVNKLTPALLAAIGDIDTGSVVFGDFKAKPVSIPVSGGLLLGETQTFDFGLHDFRKPPQPFVNQARYKVNFPALFAAFPELAGNPLALLVAPRIIPQSLYNRCPVDYFIPPLRALLTSRLSDYDGVPLASGMPRCHSHEQDVPRTAQGNWFNDLDPTNDALLDEEHAIALVNWNVTPTVQLFSLNENVPGFVPAMLDPPNDVNAPYEFPVRPGPQRTNRRFAEIVDDALYCYDLVRIHRGGPQLKGVILIQVTNGPGGSRTKLNFEIVPVSRCPALPQPWAFSAKAVAYYR
jgi:hypothetical protein